MFNRHSLTPWAISGSTRREIGIISGSIWGSFQGWGWFRGRDNFGGCTAPMSEYSKLVIQAELKAGLTSWGFWGFLTVQESRPGCLDARRHAFQVVSTKGVLLVRNRIFTSVYAGKKCGKGNWKWLVDRNKFLPWEPFWVFPSSFFSINW